MALFSNSGRITWRLALSVWLFLSIPCWIGTPYRVIREWPTTVGIDLTGFVPGKNAILTDWFRDREFGGVNQLDLETGEVRELYRTKSFEHSKQFAGNRWLVIFSHKDDGRLRVTLYDMSTERQLSHDLGDFANIPSSESSPSGRFVVIRGENGAFWVIDFGIEPPKVVAKSPDSDDIKTCEVGFGIDDQGRIVVTRGTESNPEKLTTVCRYDMESEQWQIIYKVRPNEGPLSILKDEDGKLVATLPHRKSPRTYVDIETGLPTTVRFTPDLDLTRSDNRYLEWLDIKFPSLEIKPSAEQIEYRTRSGEVYVIDSRRVSLLDDFFQAGLLPDQTHPYVVYSDDRGVHVMDDPPRRSIGFFLGMWFGCGILMAGFARFGIWWMAAYRKNYGSTKFS